MDDVIYHGCRIRTYAWTIPSGGFRSEAVIWFEEETSGWSRPVMLRGSWDSEEEAQRHALDEARRLVDARLASVGCAPPN